MKNTTVYKHVNGMLATDDRTSKTAKLKKILNCCTFTYDDMTHDV